MWVFVKVSTGWTTGPVYKAKLENIFLAPRGNENDPTLIEAIQ
jgi:hypothetical protein